jgi:hypothetical protein
LQQQQQGDDGMLGSDDSDMIAREAANQRALNRFAWIFGSGLALSLTVPQLFFAATISSFSALGAGLLATIGLFARDDIFAPHLTRWDVAAALYAVSLFAGLFVDLPGLQLALLLHDSGIR